MEPVRGIRDDLKWALAVLAGSLAGAVIFGADWSIVVGALLGATLVVLVRTLLRRR